MLESPHVREATDADFVAAVLERSRTVPVVVDFWAEWCSPCRQLGPILERLAVEGRGKWELVKVNVDRNRQVAAQLRVRSIPAVKAFMGGRVVAEFVGAVPEAQVRAFVARLLPTEADELAKEATGHQRMGDSDAAEDGFRKALEEDPSHPRAVVGLASLLAARGEHDEALSLLERRAADPAAEALRARIVLDRAGRGVDVEALLARVEEAPEDAAARYDLGRALAARGDYDDALEHLLEVVRLDRALDDDGGRRAMLDVFLVLGADDERTRRYRRTLAMII